MNIIQRITKLEETLKLKESFPEDYSKFLQSLEDLFDLVFESAESLAQEGEGYYSFLRNTREGIRKSWNDRVIEGKFGTTLKL